MSPDNVIAGPIVMAVSYTHQMCIRDRTIMPEGDYKIEDTIAILTDEEGNDIPVTMIQRLPVKRAMTNYKEKPRPFKLLETGVRVIDTLNPIVEGLSLIHISPHPPAMGNDL